MEITIPPAENDIDKAVERQLVQEFPLDPNNYT